MRILLIQAKSIIPKSLQCAAMITVHDVNSEINKLIRTHISSGVRKYGLTLKRWQEHANLLERLLELKFRLHAQRTILFQQVNNQRRKFKSSSQENKTGSSQVGAISKVRKYSKNNYWKHLEKLFFFKKKFLEFFFRKKYFLESCTMPKNSKRGHSGSLNVFTNRKLQKNARGYPLIESENFRKNVA